MFNDGKGKIKSGARSLAGDQMAVYFDERAGVKFADADLIGWPLQIVVGKRGLKEDKVEIKLRRTGEKRDISIEAVAEALAFTKRNIKGSGIGAFGSLFSD